MKMEFDDKSYIEVQKSPEPDKLFITIAAKSIDNKLIVNSVELSQKELLALIKSA